MKFASRKHSSPTDYETPAYGAEARVVEAERNKPPVAPSAVSAPVEYFPHVAFRSLEQNLRREVSRRWPQPCEAAFEFVLEDSPEQLARVIESQMLRGGDLTFAAEILGRASETDGAVVRRALLPLLAHPEAVVREGAVYGLTRHQDAAVQRALETMAANDPYEVLRTAALDALEERETGASSEIDE
jgi:hypothetical protein